MKITLLPKITIAIISLAAISWYFWPVTPQQSNIIVKTPVKPPATPTVVTPPSAPPSPQTPTIVKPLKISANDSAIFIAKVYATQLTFPAYSQPLGSNDFDRLNQNHFNPQTIPVDDNGTTISAQLSKYRFAYPEPIDAMLIGENIDYAQLDLIDINSGDTLLSSQFNQHDNQWTAQLNGQQDLPAGLQANVRARVNGKNITIALALKYIESVATLEGFEPAFHQDSDMVIRGNITTKSKGLYRVRANLFDANMQPIAHLVSKERLDKGSNTIDLKAHQSVLQGQQGSLFLSSFTIELMSPAPGKPTRYGDSAIKQYEIKNFAFSSLNETPYQPSQQEQQRLLLLQNMAQGL